MTMKWTDNINLPKKREHDYLGGFDYEFVLNVATMPVLLTEKIPTTIHGILLQQDFWWRPEKEGPWPLHSVTQSSTYFLK